MNVAFQSTFALGRAELAVPRPWWGYVLWIPAAALLGFAISWFFAGHLHQQRSLFLVPYVALVSLFLYAFVRWSALSVAALFRHNWGWGVVGAVLLGAFLVRNVVSQPASPRATGFSLAADLLWSGVVYGVIDALLLSVLPMVAIWQAASILGWSTAWPGKIGVSVIAVIASLFVTICYHLGYPEYRVQGGVVGPTVGNGMMTLGYLLTNNPITAIVSHIAMHIAGVWHGSTFVMQLPPHY